MEDLANSLNDITKINVIYSILLLASANELNFFTTTSKILATITMDYNNATLLDVIDPSEAGTTNLNFIPDLNNASSGSSEDEKPSLIIRMSRRLFLLMDRFIDFVRSQCNEQTATSVASLSVLIILLSIICCFIISLMREEERKIKEQYKKLNAGSSQSFIAINGSSGYQKISDHSLSCNLTEPTIITQPSIAPSLKSQSKMHVIELRRETYFGLVRLLKPGCRTIVLLCDSQSRFKLLAKFYNCIYPYRKNKMLFFAFLMIEKNINWYKDLLRLALNEKRELQINPINCIGTVLVLNGFKKYFSVYHASDSRCDPDEPFLLLEESLLDNLPSWLERFFAGKINRYYVKYWPEQMR